MPADTGLSGIGLLAALAAALLIAALSIILWRVLPVLLARYDGRVMRVEPPGGPVLHPWESLAPGEQATWEQLQRWCLAGAGTGSCSFWRPWGRPEVVQRLSVAMLISDGSSAQRALVERFSRQLDGSVELARAGGAWAGLWLRLRVKRNDALWWRKRQADDPWDCGYLANDGATREALRQFRPRRATLLVATSDGPAATWRHDIEALHARRAGFHHPVRVLVVVPPGAAPQGGGIPAWNGLPCEMSLIRGLEG